MPGAAQMGVSMRKITNPSLLKRNRTIGSVVNIVGIMIGVVITYFYFVNSTLENLGPMYGMLFLAFVLILVGNYLTNRYGHTPSPDVAIDNLLKGLDDTYTAIHYRLGHDHALFTPDGVLAILPKFEHGDIVFDGKKSWRQTGISFGRKFFGSEQVGDPIADGRFSAEMLAKSLQKILKLEALPEVRPVVVFVNDGTVVDADQAPLPVLPAAKFKDYIRKLEKRAGISPSQLQEVIEFCGEKP
jgi:hypothetical protein